MAFNSNTYHANKRAREARHWLAEARARRDRGESLESIGIAVTLARNSMKLSLISRRLRELEKGGY